MPHHDYRFQSLALEADALGNAAAKVPAVGHILVVASPQRSVWVATALSKADRAIHVASPDAALGRMHSIALLIVDVAAVTRDELHALASALAGRMLLLVGKGQQMPDLPIPCLALPCETHHLQAVASRWLS